MLINLTADYKKTYKRIQSRLTFERLHPKALKQANCELLSYVEERQSQHQELEEDDIIFNKIIQNKLHRSHKTHVLLWIAIPCLFFFIVSFSNVLMNLLSNNHQNAMISLSNLVLAFYTSYIVIEGVPDPFVLLFIFSGIPVAALMVMIERYFMLDYSQINVVLTSVVCLLIFLLSNYFINKEYDDWRKSHE